MSEPEVYQIDLDDDLVQHLAISKSVEVLWLEGISPELLSEDAGEIFAWQLRHRHEHKVSASASVLAEEFDLEFQDPLCSIGDLIERLQARWVKKNIKSEMEPVTTAFQEDPMLVIPALQTALKNITGVIRSGKDTIGTGEFDKVLNHYERSAEKGMGPSSGFAEIDDHFHGLRGVTFYLGTPKIGKSWLGINSQMENVIRGKCVWNYSLELPVEEATARLYHMTAGVPWWKHIKHKLNDLDKRMLREAAEFLDDQGLFKMVKPPAGERSVDEMVYRAQEGGADLIIFDQLQYIEYAHKRGLGNADPGQYWLVLNRIRDLSDEIPLLVIHQFNRSTMGADSLPDMAQAKGSAGIEETATLVLGAWASKDMRRSNLIELGTLASRNASWKNWEIGMNLQKGCELVYNGESVS